MLSVNKAVNAALAGSGSEVNVFSEVFLNWGLANWVNAQARGQKLGYTGLRNRKVTAAVPRVFSYPSEMNNISIDQWSAHYIRFENLPETLDISLTGTDSGNLYATTLYLSANGQAVVAPIPFDTQNRGHIRREGLQRNGEIVLMVTADAPQMFSYIAVDKREGFEIGALREWTSDTMPDVVTDAVGSRTQPSMFRIDLKPETQLEPMTQIHLASDYTDIVMSGTDVAYLYAASHWGFEIFSLAEPTQPVRIGEIATPGQARSVVVDGDMAYVADGAAGVHVIDIAVPTAPKVLKTLGGFTDARKVQVANGNLYVLGRARGMLVYNQNNVRDAQTLDLDVFFALMARQSMLLSMMILFT